MTVSKRLRYEVMARDGYACKYCHATEVQLTVDHVVPRTLGGQDTLENLVACCIPCNSGKTSTRPPLSLLERIDDETLRWAAAQRQVAADIAKERARQVAAPAQPASKWTLSEAGRWFLDYASQLYDADIEVWEMTGRQECGEISELHRAQSVCVDIPRFTTALLDQEMNGCSLLEARKRAQEEPWWCDMPPDRDGEDWSSWVLPSMFCEVCLPEEADTYNQDLPEYMLLGEPKPVE